MKSHTKDEKYLIALYEMAMEAGDIETEFDKYEVGIRAHLQPKGVNAISQLLFRANFIKRGDENMIHLTPHGEKLVLQLLEE